MTWAHRGSTSRYSTGKDSRLRGPSRRRAPLPMMADTRFVLIRPRRMPCRPPNKTRSQSTSPTPSESACVVLTADKLDGRGKLAKGCEKSRRFFDRREAGFVVVSCASSFAREAKSREHSNRTSSAVEALLDAVGDDLACDRRCNRATLACSSAPGQRIDEECGDARCVTRIRVESIWSLVDAIGLEGSDAKASPRRNRYSTIASRLSACWRWSRGNFRIVARMREALSEGLRP